MTRGWNKTRFESIFAFTLIPHIYIYIYPVFERARHVLAVHACLRQNDQETERIALAITGAVRFTDRLVELGAFARTPRITEFVVAERCLEVGVFLCPTDARRGALG